MSVLPPDWPIKNIKEAQAEEDSQPSPPDKVVLSAQLAVNPAPGEEGFFRVYLKGSALLKVRVEASKIIPDEGLCGFFLYGEFHPEKQIRYCKLFAITMAVSGHDLTNDLTRRKIPVLLKLSYSYTGWHVS